MVVLHSGSKTVSDPAFQRAVASAETVLTPTIASRA